MPRRSDRFMGIPLKDLVIAEIEWPDEVSEKIRHRRRAKKSPREFDVEPEWASEAASDGKGLRGVASPRSIAIVGWSRSAARHLVVVLVPKEFDPSSGRWWGASAWAANDRDRRTYEEQEG